MGVCVCGGAKTATEAAAAGKRIYLRCLVSPSKLWVVVGYKNSDMKIWKAGRKTDVLQNNKRCHTHARTHSQQCSSMQFGYFFLSFCKELQLEHFFSVALVLWTL